MYDLQVVNCFQFFNFSGVSRSDSSGFPWLILLTRIIADDRVVDCSGAATSGSQIQGYDFEENTVGPRWVPYLVISSMPCHACLRFEWRTVATLTEAWTSSCFFSV